MIRHRILSLAGGMVAVCTLALFVGVDAKGSASVKAAGPTTFTDASGDVKGTAPDITAVVVGDDYTTGKITVTVTASGYAASTAPAALVFVYLDTDQNASTGSPSGGGADYVFAAAKDSGGSGWWISRWDGSAFTDVAQSATMDFVRDGDTMTWTANKSDIGASTGFRFWVLAGALDSSDNPIGADSGPDDGMWSYDLSTPPPAPPPPAPVVVVKPVIGAPKVTPTRVLAGARLTVVFPVTRSDTGVALTSGKLICDPSVSGKVIPHAESFAGGKARLSFVVPKSAKGKALKVKVTIKVGTQAATRIATLQVR